MLDGLRILVVEDVPAVRKLMVSLLALEGATVVEACTGREACERVREAAFDVALTDLGLPDIPGEAVVAYVRASSGGRTPVAVLSGANEADLARALALGAERAFAKPIDWEELLAYLTRQMAVAA
ncbi:MAG: response regulator [Candidatus Rokubacteria bacterium]|nr:response regulator [Candidatus Rokubacteria bacterium]